jgi:hypothetical protein
MVERSAPGSRASGTGAEEFAAFRAFLGELLRSVKVIADGSVERAPDQPPFDDSDDPSVGSLEAA